jgi:hypothetical protein
VIIIIIIKTVKECEKKKTITVIYKILKKDLMIFNNKQWSSDYNEKWLCLKFVRNKKELWKSVRNKEHQLNFRDNSEYYTF